MSDIQRFDQQGEIASYRADDGAPVYDFDKGWGNQLDADKDTALTDRTLTIVGIEQGQDFGLGMTYFLLVKFDTDPAELEPWGVMFSETSPVVQQTRSMVNKGKFPFRAKFVKKQSASHKGQGYWTFERPEQPQLPQPEVSESGRGKK